ncbi:MAG: metal-dependent transcriptional regulator [Clostridia bacterium]|nr:metal-dependent transcriptional regulator [Clostridia bacterium]
MEIRESGEDYLEQILILQTQGGYARSIDIAVAMNFSKPSVSIAMKTLRERGYITMDAESHIRLTESGRAIAERIYDRHQRLTAVLISLGVSPEAAREDACKMEHDLSDETFHALCKLLDRKDA